MASAHNRTILPAALFAAALPLCTASGQEVQQATQAVPPAGCTGTPTPTWITVVAEGLRSNHGLLAMTVYADNPRKFLVKRGSIFVGRVQVQGAVTRGCVFLPAPGVYAIALYHDENANLKLDRSAIGLPKEGWGFTNNPPTFFGLPSFRSVRLKVGGTGLVTHITMKYP